MSFEALRWGARQRVGGGGEKAVLWELCNLANKDKGHTAWPSLQGLIEACGFGETAVRTAIKGLAERGLIEILGSTVRRHYRMKLEIDQPHQAAIRRDALAIRRNTLGIRGNTLGIRGLSNHDPFNNPSGADAKRIHESVTQAAGLSDEERAWQRRLGAHAKNGFWHPNWGDRPGSPHCRAPQSVLARFGYRAAASEAALGEAAE